MDKYKWIDIPESAFRARDPEICEAVWDVDHDGDFVLSESYIRNRAEAVNLIDALQEYIHWLDNREEST